MPLQARLLAFCCAVMEFIKEVCNGETLINGLQPEKIELARRMQSKEETNEFPKPLN